MIKLWWKRRKLRKEINSKKESQSLAWVLGLHGVSDSLGRKVDILEQELRDTYER